MDSLGTRPLLVVIIAGIASAALAVAVNLIDSLLLAWLVILMLPIVMGSFAGYSLVSGTFGLLTVVVAITAFFAAGAAMTQGHEASLSAEIYSYVLIGFVMFVVGSISYIAMRIAHSTTPAEPIE